MVARNLHQAEAYKKYQLDGDFTPRKPILTEKQQKTGSSGEFYSTRGDFNKGVKTMRKRLSDNERKAIVALMVAGKKRKEIADLFQIDPTGVDKVKSGYESNPKYLEEKWENITDERKEELLSKIESGEMSYTSVANGWCTCQATIEAALKARKPATSEEIDVLKTVVINCKKYYATRFGGNVDRVIMSAVIDALGTQID